MVAIKKKSMIRKLYREEKKYECANSRSIYIPFEMIDEKKIKKNSDFLQRYLQKSENAVTQRRSTGYEVILNNKY